MPLSALHQAGCVPSMIDDSFSPYSFSLQMVVRRLSAVVNPTGRCLMPGYHMTGRGRVRCELCSPGQSLLLHSPKVPRLLSAVSTMLVYDILCFKPSNFGNVPWPPQRQCRADASSRHRLVDVPAVHQTALLNRCQAAGIPSSRRRRSSKRGWC